MVKPGSQHRRLTLRASLLRVAVLLHAPRRHAVRRIAIVLGLRLKPCPSPAALRGEAGVSVAPPLGAASS